MNGKGDLPEATDPLQSDSGHSATVPFGSESVISHSNHRAPITAVVVPCYNEEKRLKLEEFSRFLDHQPDFRFHFVDDGSKDRTAELLSEFCELNSSATYESLSPNGGKAEAVRCGIQSVIKAQQSDQKIQHVAYWDADLATPLEELPRFRDTLLHQPEIDFVAGSRLKLSGHHIDRKPSRRLLGSCFAKVATFLLGIPLRDTQCGAKMLRLNSRTTLLFEKQFSSRWIFDVEILSRLRLLLEREDKKINLQKVVFEQPLDSWFEIAGSKLKPSDFLKAFRELFTIAYRYRVVKEWIPSELALNGKLEHPLQTKDPERLQSNQRAA